MAEGLTPLVQLLLSLLALLGHFALWLGAFSRVHSLGLRRPLLHLLDRVFLLMLVCVPALVVWNTDEQLVLLPLEIQHAHWAAQSYFWLCFGLALYTALLWCWRTWVGDSAHLLTQQRRVVHVTKELGHRPCGDTATRLLSLIPGNQILQIEIAEKSVFLPRLPAALDGLSIVHLSDLHFCGRLTEAYFDLVVARANALQPDLVAITGDIVDRRQCVPWMVDILGNLQARWGKFCVFGNHELRIDDTPLLIRTAQQAGLQYVGDRWCPIEIRGQMIAVAGNQLPWIKPAADRQAAPVAPDRHRPFRILLSHSPDQIGWARRGDFDLMLAGHTHGGQIRLPVIGPLVGESRFGVKYCGSLFYEHPTLLHVSRGVSALQNLRLNCRPELVKLVLRCGRAACADDPEFVAANDFVPQPEPAVGRLGWNDGAIELQQRSDG
jgi:predicted MPP superfamily phosphohydrolase